MSHDGLQFAFGFVIVNARLQQVSLGDSDEVPFQPLAFVDGPVVL